MSAKQLEVAKPAGEIQPLADGILNVIARAAADPNTDVDKLERLLAMQERVLARDAEQAFNAAMRTAQEEIRPVVKNKRNTETKSTYANLEAISQAIDPILHRHGFSFSFGTKVSDLPAHYCVTCAVSHTAGHTREYQADVPVDNVGPKGAQNKTMTHGFGSALSYGRRYLKMLIADVATTDDDGNAAARVGDRIDEAQYAALVTLIENVGADTKRFLRYFKIERVSDLLAKDYDRAVRLLQQKARS